MKIYHIGLCATQGTNNGLQRAFRNVSEYHEVHTGHPDLHNQILNDVRAFKPDLVFMQIQTPNIVSINTIRKMKEHCGKIINFTGDVRDPLPNWYVEMGKEIDLTLYVSMDDVRKSKEIGIKADWLQLGFDETIYNDKVNPANVAEIVFTANNYHHFTLSKERQTAAHALQTEFGKRFQLYGSGWTIPSLDSNHSMEQQAAVLQGVK